MLHLIETSANRDRYVVVDHVVYFDQGHIDSFMRGFGGREFLIKYYDGREVTTTNLWHVGNLPEELFETLPDTAVFLKTERDTRIDEFIEAMMNRPTKTEYKKGQDE